jgi:hypothetical protein
MNVEHDVKAVGVQTIMLVEDSVRFYSSSLSLLYKFVLSDSKEFAKEALNDHLQTLKDERQGLRYYWQELTRRGD